jgi:hypothetical protein
LGNQLELAGVDGSGGLWCRESDAHTRDPSGYDKFGNGAFLIDRRANLSILGHGIQHIEYSGNVGGERSGGW